MQIFVRSGNATSVDDDGTYTWLYPTPVVFGQPGDDIQVCVSLLQFYPILKNLETIDEHFRAYPRDPNGPSPGYGTLIPVPPANYNVNSLIEVFNKAWGTAIPDDRLELTFDTSTLQFVIKRPSASTVDELITLKGSPRLLTMCGFTPGSETFLEYIPGPYEQNEEGIWVEGPGTYVPVWTGMNEIRSPSVVNFGGPTHVVVETSLQSTNVADANLSSSVLAKVPIMGTGFGELVTFQDTSTFSTLADHEITSLSIRFKDSFDNPIRFGALPWNLTLLFKVTPAGTYQPLEKQYSVTPDQTADNGNRDQLASRGT